MAVPDGSITRPTPLKTSIAGIRGEAGTALTAELAVRLAAAFGSYLYDGVRPPLVHLSRDTRPSGQMLSAAVRSALMATGCHVHDLGVCPTPVMQFSVHAGGAQGGIAITAGHGPEHWNALKFVGPDGVFLDHHQGAELLDHFHHNRPRWVEFTELGQLQAAAAETTAAAAAAHREAVLGLVDVGAIRARRFKVAVDLANGACCQATPALLADLGCEVISINDEPDQPFPHPPEPNPRNMGQLRALVRAGGADLGFCHDADGDRLGITADGGQPLEPPLTLALTAEAVLSRRPGVVVTNLSTSRLIEDVAASHGGSVVRVKVGQSYIAEGVHIHQAVLGGEGSGGVMFPSLTLAHDSLAAMAQVLDLLARREQRLSELVGRWPRYVWREVPMPLPPGQVFRRLAALRDWAEAGVDGAVVDLTEGVRLAWDDAWCHVRSSITEPVLRLVGEGISAAATDRRLEQVIERLRA